MSESIELLLDIFSAHILIIRGTVKRLLIVVKGFFCLPIHMVVISKPLVCGTLRIKNASQQYVFQYGDGLFLSLSR